MAGVDVGAGGRGEKEWAESRDLTGGLRAGARNEGLALLTQAAVEQDDAGTLEGGHSPRGVRGASAIVRCGRRREREGVAM